jgi:hypothetical protein
MIGLRLWVAIHLIPLWKEVLWIPLNFGFVSVRRLRFLP